MHAMTIICTNCGIEGEIEVHGLNGDVPSSKIFRHLGHNPFSGDMHYQCPACEIVLLVDPMTVLMYSKITPFPYRLPRARSNKGETVGSPHMTSVFHRLLGNPWL